jgi:hypothetical protein
MAEINIALTPRFQRTFPGPDENIVAGLTVQEQANNSLARSIGEAMDSANRTSNILMGQAKEGFNQAQIGFDILKKEHDLMQKARSSKLDIEHAKEYDTAYADIITDPALLADPQQLTNRVQVLNQRLEEKYQKQANKMGLTREFQITLTRSRQKRGLDSLADVRREQTVRVNNNYRGQLWVQVDAYKENPNLNSSGVEGARQELYNYVDIGIAKGSWTPQQGVEIKNVIESDLTKSVFQRIIDVDEDSAADAVRLIRADKDGFFAKHPTLQAQLIKYAKGSILDAHQERRRRLAEVDQDLARKNRDRFNLFVQEAAAGRSNSAFLALKKEAANDSDLSGAFLDAQAYRDKERARSLRALQEFPSNPAIVRRLQRIALLGQDADGNIVTTKQMIDQLDIAHGAQELNTDGYLSVLNTFLQTNRRELSEKEREIRKATQNAGVRYDGILGKDSSIADNAQLELLQTLEAKLKIDPAMNVDIEVDNFNKTRFYELAGTRLFPDRLFVEAKKDKMTIDEKVEQQVERLLFKIHSYKSTEDAKNAGISLETLAKIAEDERIIISVSQTRREQLRKRDEGAHDRAVEEARRRLEEAEARIPEEARTRLEEEAQARAEREQERAARRAARETARQLRPVDAIQQEGKTIRDELLKLSSLEGSEFNRLVEQEIERRREAGVLFPERQRDSIIRSFNELFFKAQQQREQEQRFKDVQKRAEEQRLIREAEEARRKLERLQGGTK